MFHVEHLVRSEKLRVLDALLRKARYSDAFEECFLARRLLPTARNRLDPALRAPAHPVRHKTPREESTIAVPGKPSKRRCLPLGFPPAPDFLERGLQLPGALP